MWLTHCPIIFGHHNNYYRSLICRFGLIFVISESNQSLKLGMLSEVVCILISDSDRFLLMLSNSWFSLMFDVNVDAF